jgi:hypothetical protein
MQTDERRHQNINLILPSTYKEQLTAWAKKNQYSVTYVIRQAIREFFAKKGVDLP